MIITKENNEYKAVQKLPDGSMSVGTGKTVQNAIAWCQWGVKGYYTRIERAIKPVKKSVMAFFTAKA